MKIREIAVAVAMEEVMGQCVECALVKSEFAQEYAYDHATKVVDDSDSAWEYEMEHADEPLVNYGFGSDVSFQFIGMSGKYAFMLGTHTDGTQLVAWVNTNDNDCVDQVDGVEFLQDLMGWENFCSTYWAEYNRFLWEQQGR